MQLDPLYEKARGIECDAKDAKRELESAVAYAELAADGKDAEKNIAVAMKYVDKAKLAISRIP